MALKVGDVAPDFKLPSTKGDQQGEVKLSDYRGKNVILVFYPLDFTSVCSGELAAFQADLARFEDHNAQIVAISTDSVPCHIQFQKHLGGLTFPLAADRWPYAETAKAYGIFPAVEKPQLGVNERAIFVVDKKGKIAWLKVYKLGERPDTREVLDVVRQLD